MNTSVYLWYNVTGPAQVSGVGRFLCVRWSFGFHKMRYTSWLLQNRLVFQEGFCSKELVCSVFTVKSSLLILCSQPIKQIYHPCIPVIWSGSEKTTLFNSSKNLILTFFFIWPNSPQWARAPSSPRFLHHTQRSTTIVRTPLDEWSARRRDLYLTTHNTNNRQTSLPPVGFEPTISAGKRPQTHALDRAATGTDYLDLHG